MTGERALLVLASASPRRAELLEAAGLLFRVEPSHVDEELPPGIAPEEGALLLAARKARAVARGHAGTADWVLGADTIVALPEDFPPLAEQLRSSTRTGVATLARILRRPPGEHGTIAVDLPPGRYGFLCFVADADGVAHAVKGMAAEIRVS